MARRLKHELLWQVRAVVPRAMEEAAAAAFEQVLEVSPVSYTIPEENTVQLSVYLPERHKPGRRHCQMLCNQLQGIAGMRVSLKVSRLADRDWRNSWKLHFPPVTIGTRLLLRPSWSRRRAKPGQAVVVLDPGLSFGTGQHPTTSFCLRELVRRRVPGLEQSFLDLGTGSGILAIAAVKMGYAPALALDYDPDCIRVAQNNARRNRVADRLTIRRAEVGQLSRQPRVRHDVVCANLLAPLLVKEADRISAQVRPGGWLVVAGILDREFLTVHQPIVALGGVLDSQCVEGDWHSVAYRFLV